MFHFLFTLALVLAVFLSATDLSASSTDHHVEATTEHPLSDLHEMAPCDEGFVCSAYILLDGFGNGFSDTEYRIFLISSEVPFRHFMSPQVDLPPPRIAA